MPAAYFRHLVVGAVAAVIAWLLWIGVLPQRAEAAEQYGTPALPLHRVHHELRCPQCHRADGEVVNTLCTACHKDIASTMKAERGLHGNAAIRSQACTQCHKEHQGVEAEALFGWKSPLITDPGTGRFLHRLTGFPLTQPKHLDRACTDCHHGMRPSGIKTYVDTARQCFPCHKDPHAATLGRDCLRCHEETSWSPSRMEHNRDTNFALTGNHQVAARKGRCGGCHSRPPAPQSFKQDSACSSQACHLRDDKHQGENGRECQDCHQPTTWQEARSAKEGHNISPQPFAGAHDRVVGTGRCRTCHNRPGLQGMGNLCITCHQRDDIHHNALGPRCGDCHTQQTFLGARFNHDSVGCTLRGIHRMLPCVDCHKGGNYSGLAPMCISCHRDDAMRAAATVRGIPAELHVVQTACTHCHNTRSFRLGAGTRNSPPESVCQ